MKRLLVVPPLPDWNLPAFAARILVRLFLLVAGTLGLCGHRLSAETYHVRVEDDQFMPAYLTVAPGGEGGVTFRPDPYGFAALAMPQMFGPTRIASAS